MKYAVALNIVLAATMALPAFAQQAAPGGHFIENWDMNEDGQVTVEEATQKRDEIFTMFDQDENGSLDTAEYDMFDETRQIDMNENAGAKGARMGKLSQAMQREFNDTDKDGQVTRQEFLSGVTPWFDQMDRDKDQVITSQDFRPGKG